MKLAAVGMLILLAGCASAPPASIPGTPVPSAVPASPVAEAGAFFYEALRPGPAALLVRQPATRAEAYAEATAVVVAEVTAVTAGCSAISSTPSSSSSRSG